MRNKTKQQNRKVNYMLSNGLYVISAKSRIGTPLYVLYLTDFVVNTRVVFDAETLKTLPNKYGIEIGKSDMEGLVKALGWELKKVAVPAANPAPSIFSEYKKIVGVVNGKAVLEGDKKVIPVLIPDLSSTDVVVPNMNAAPVVPGAPVEVKILPF